MSDKQTTPTIPVELESFLQRLESGECRAARPTDDGHWAVDPSVKESILKIFRDSPARVGTSGDFPFVDRGWLWPSTELPDQVRVVPGGTAIRRGAHLGHGVVVMPPSYVNVGAFIDEGTMVDSHVLVGSCAQIGKRVHLSAGVQIGGVLEPVGALPVIVEDDAFIGGLCGLFEGVRIGRQAVLAAGVTLTASKPLLDLVHQRRVDAVDGVMTVPERAVVVSGTRQLTTSCSQEMAVATDVALIIKYRDPSTDARLALETALR